MATYNTGNPLGSADPRDLYDNSAGLDDAVNGTALTWVDRLGVTRPTWKGIEANSAAGSYTVRTIEQLNDITPPEGTSPSGRVTEGAGKGYYVWEDGAWEETDDPLAEDRNATSPAFVPGTRGGVTSPAPSAAQAVVYDIMIHGAQPGKDYALQLIQNQSTAFDPVGPGDGIIVMEYDAGTWDNPVQAIGRLNPVTIDRTTDKQSVHIASTSIPGLSVSLLLNPKALPPAGTAIRMSLTSDPGYSWKISATRYQYSDRSFVAELTSLNINRDNIYPFVPKKRNNVDPVTPSSTTEAWMKAIVDVRVVNARDGKFYHIEGAYSPARVDYPCALIIVESDVENFETAYTGTRIVTYTDTPPVYPANQGIQTVIVRSARADWADIEFYITLDTDNLPASPLAASNSGQSGYAYIISPDRYTLRQVRGGSTTDNSGDMLLEGMGANAVFATFNRDSAFDFEVLMMPNGANGLFNFRSTYAINRDNAERTELMQTNSDMVPPLQILSNESNVDVIPPDEEPNGYTGGNHTSDGGTGGTPTATMASIEHYMDGVKVDATAKFKSGASEYRIRWVNKLMAWNTKVLGRYVVDQIVTAIIRKGTVEVWCKITALENITVRMDNGLQSIATGFDNILFYNGENKTSRVAITSGLTSGPFTTTGAGCFAASLKGSAAAGLQTVWYDRQFGVGDGSHIGGSAGRFRVNGGKVYGAAITSNRPITLAAGESYEWHMGISWSGLEGFEGIDSAVTAYVNNEPTLMYAKLNAGAGTIRMPEGEIINGQTVGASGYHTSEAAGAHMYSIESANYQAIVDKAVASSSAYTDASVAVVDGKYSNLEKYGVENPLRVYKAGDRAGLSIYRYTATEEKGLIVLTSTNSAAGYLFSAGPRGLSPLGMVFRFSIKKVSGTVPDYVLSINGTIDTSANRYGEGRRIESPEFVTYEVDVSSRPDGSAWADGETISTVYIALSAVEEGETNSIYRLKFLSYGYRDIPYPIRYPGYENGDTPEPTPDPVIVNAAPKDRAPLVSFGDNGGYFVLDENGNEVAGPNAIAALVNRIDALEPGGGGDAAVVPRNPVYFDDGVIKTVTESGEEVFMDLTPHQFLGSVQWNGKYALTAVNRATIGAITPVALSTGEDWIGTKLVLPCGTKLMIVIISFGQSNSVGAQGYEPATVLKENHYPENLLMCDGPVSLDVRFNLPSGSESVGAEVELNPDSITHFKPLVSMRNPSLPGQGATMMESMAYTFEDAVFKATGLKPTIVVAAAGWGGRYQSNLAKGSIPYNNFMKALTKIKALAEADGYKVFVPCVPIIHGESDSIRTSYLDSIKTWQSDFSADIKAITGQLADVPFLCTQASTFSGDTAVNGVLAPWNAAQDTPALFHVSTPYYPYPLVNDLLHLGPSSPVIGEKMGHAIARISGLFGEHELGHLQPISITYDGSSTIDIEFYVPTLPLVRDTTDTVVNSPAPDNWGFVVRDGTGAAVTISSVSFLNDTTVRIVTASAPASGASRSVDYALSGFPGSPKVRGLHARGQLRDSTNVNSIITGQPLYDWCVHFRKSF